MNLNLNDKQQHKITQAILNWFDQNGRKGLPWQSPPKGNEAYATWVSEIMLQQTQVKTVIPYYVKFMDRFPDIETLSNASLDEVLHHWSGLGYYARARNLHKAAHIISNQYGGKMPNNYDHIVALPGIGKSTAGAIMAFVFKQHYPILDGNVKRVLTRLMAIKGFPAEKAIETRLWSLAHQLTPVKRVEHYTQAIMDLGATTCTRSKPKCDQCPLDKHCQANLQNAQHLYPSKKPKKASPTKTTQMWLLQNADRQILLHKRPPTGVWGGLWTPPEAPDCKALQQKIGFDTTLLEWRKLPVVTHKFSHFCLHITPYIAQITDSQINLLKIQDSDMLTWYNSEVKKQLGLPAPVLNLIQKTL